MFNSSAVQIFNMSFPSVKEKKVIFGYRILILMLATLVNCNRPSFWIFAFFCVFPEVD